MSEGEKNDRYQRQILLKDFGEVAQKKLQQAKILIIGAGGLGCPALQYLCAAGVGKIGVIDFDRVELSNLHRQILFSMEDIGKLKAEVAAEKLKKLNPDCEIIPYPLELNTKNALELIKDYDLVLDGSDNFPTRYLVNDACVLLDKPLVYGAVLAFEGQVAVFNIPDKKTGIKTSYRDLFPIPPDPANSPSCNEAGVIGVIPGIIGCMQAAEAIKIICGLGEILSNKIISYSALNNTYYDFEIQTKDKSGFDYPKTKSEFLNFDYAWHCSAAGSELDIAAFEALNKNKDWLVIDVRESGELPVVTEFNHIQIPLSNFENALPEIRTNKSILLFCKSGTRSLKALRILKIKFPQTMAFSLKGGIDKLKQKN